MTRQNPPAPAALLPIERWFTTALACLIVLLGILMLSPSRSTNPRSPADRADVDRHPGVPAEEPARASVGTTPGPTAPRVPVASASPSPQRADLSLLGYAADSGSAPADVAPDR